MFISSFFAMCVLKGLSVHRKVTGSIPEPEASLSGLIQAF